MILEKRPTKAVVSLTNLVANLRAVESRLPAGQEVLPVIKANAYGHGAVPVAQALVNAGIKKLAVATLEEGVELRSHKVEVPVYVLNGILGSLRTYQQQHLTPVLHHLKEFEQIKHLIEVSNQDLTIGLKFDTGMGRLGIQPHQLDKVLMILKNNPQIHVDVVITHMACADESLEQTLKPYETFRGIREAFRAAGFSQTNFSICNSASILDGHFDDYDWVRPGLALYGAYPHPRQSESLALNPVLQLKTRLIELKPLVAGSPVGYGATFVTERDSIIAILPIGYADGYPRLISNRGHVLVRGKKAPIVGRISMDLMAIDVTEIKDACLYDEVTLIGTDGTEIIRVEDVAQWAQTISYEILTSVMPRVFREYV